MIPKVKKYNPPFNHSTLLKIYGSIDYRHSRLQLILTCFLIQDCSMLLTQSNTPQVGVFLVFLVLLLRIDVSHKIHKFMCYFYKHFEVTFFEHLALQFSGGVPPISHNALDRIIYAIFWPRFQVIQRCPFHWKGHMDDLFDIFFTRD